MAVTRFYLRNSQANPGTGGTVYDIAETAGTATTLVSAAISGTGFTEVFRWQSTLGADLPEASIPYSVGISAVSHSSIEVRWRIQRLNSSNTVLESSSYSALHNSAGNKTGTFTFAAAWVTGDRVALSLEIRRTSGGGSRTVTIDVDIGAAVTLSTTGPTATSTTSGFGSSANQTITFTSVGDITGSANGGQDLGDWFSPSNGADGTLYWARCTYVSGETIYLSGAGLNAWLQMSSNRAWTFQNAEAGPSSRAGVYKFQIATDSGGTSVVGDRNCTITLDVESP